MSFKVDISSVLKGLAESEIKTRAAVGLYCDTAGKKLEAEAKSQIAKNIPWTNRSHQALQKTKGGYEWQGTKCVPYISGDTDYYVYLELAHEKKHAILKPTIDKLSPEILKGMKNILK